MILNKSIIAASLSIYLDTKDANKIVSQNVQIRDNEDQTVKILQEKDWQMKPNCLKKPKFKFW